MGRLQKKGHFDAEGFERRPAVVILKRGRLPRRSGRDALISYLGRVTGGPTELEGTSENEEISHYLTLIIGVVGPAFAAEKTGQSPDKHFAVKDTMGVCSVVDVKPSPASNLRLLGDKSGYPSQKDAASALGSGCNDKIDRG
jgi:hypothetical protein